MDSDAHSLPVTCIARAMVSTRTRFSSSESVLIKLGLVSGEKKRVRLGITSEFPKPVIRRSATLSML